MSSTLARIDQVRIIFEEQLERRELKLPLLPKVAASVIQLSTDEDSDAQQLARLIQSDPALASHVMRIANSPIYRPVTPFVSLQQAIARLGIVAIGEIALATSLNSELFVAPGYEPLLKELWHNSLLTSAWSREVARLKRGNVEASFLAGLLCQIGKPVVLQGLSPFGLKDQDLELFIQQYYVRAGALLANIWHLPEVVGTTIIHHQGHDCANEWADTVLNVEGALQLVTVTSPMKLDESWQEKLNLYPEDLEQLDEQKKDVQSWVEIVEV